MLKTNSKVARENIKKYIVNNTDFTGYEKYENINMNDFKTVADAILNICKEEKKHIKYINNFEMFKDWMQGLPSCGLGDFYYYNAIKPLQEILQQSDTDIKKYSEAQSEQLLCNLIYKEIEKATR